MTALLTRNPGNIGDIQITSQEQAIFPNLHFTCSGAVVKWIVAGRYPGNNNYFPELQIWRPTGSFMYQKLNGTSVTAANRVDHGIYELTVDPPLPVQPGDVLGIFQPAAPISRLIVEYDASVDSVHFYFLKDAGVTSPDTFIDINRGGWNIRTGIPLVSVELSELMVKIEKDNITVHIF